MRYLVKAKVKPDQKKPLLKAFESGKLGEGSIAGGEYVRDMKQAVQRDDGTVCWVEVCYCPIPLQEERPYWEEYFELLKVMNAHDRRKCLDLNGTEPWGCSNCDCTDRLEERMRAWGPRFLRKLRSGFHNQEDRSDNV